MNNNGTDQQLLQIVNVAAPTTIDGVIAVMQSIDDLLPGDDGLKWFNRLYLFVTKQGRDHPPAQVFADRVWLTRLDVVFANFYFRAVGSFLYQAPTPSSAPAPFQARH